MTSIRKKFFYKKDIFFVKTQFLYTFFTELSQMLDKLGTSV